MIRKILVATAAALALAACGNTEPGPDLSDDALANEMSEYVYGQPINQADNPAKLRELAPGAAEAQCEMLRDAADNGRVDTDDPATSRDFLRAYELQVQAWNVGEIRRLLEVSAKYRCPEFSDMLQVYSAATPTS
jgi:hypothetical protein